MRTRGPRLNRQRSREVVDKLKIRVFSSDGHGILIRRHMVGPAPVFNGYREEYWRVYTGGGIAGNSDSAWLQPASLASTSEKVRGPFWNKGQLEKALRAWRRGE